MRKIILFCAAVVAAMNMSAAITYMTCAEAKEAAMKLQAGGTGTDSVAVTGYVTNTNGTVSRGQQTFWLDDNKGTKQTFQAYWCNLPDANALNVGDKVVIKGFLMNYQGTTAEMKNGDTEVLERVVVKRDTISSNVCEAIEEGEALNDKEVTDDFFSIEAVVSSVQKAMNEYKQETFWMDCEDNDKQLQAYNATMKDGEEAKVGDKVSLIGRIQKFGTTIEIIGAEVKVIEKGQVKIDTISVNVAKAVEAGKALEKGKTSIAVYIVEGYADSIAFAFDETKKNMSFYMCDNMAEPSYDFEAYKVSTEKAVEKGAKVYVVGNLYHYYKAAIEDPEHPENNKPEIDLIEISEGKVFFENPLPQGIERIQTSVISSQKVMENGQLVIIKNGVKYNVVGAQVK